MTHKMLIKKIRDLLPLEGVRLHNVTPVTLKTAVKADENGVDVQKQAGF
jgi:hypothetical protein